MTKISTVLVQHNCPIFSFAYCKSLFYRMESTGVDGKIQVNEKCMHVLSEWYTFELRGSIFVKGKDNMTTYILVGNKPGANVSAVCN